jgi:hypothetical protein
MTSKMHAGLVAGGFGAALAIGLVLSAPFSPQLAYILSIALLFGLGVLSGLLAAQWLDLSDYGRQHAAGAIAGLVAASLTEVADVFLRVVFASISRTSPTSVLANRVLSRIPATSEAAAVLMMMVVNLLLYLVYLLIVIGISSAVASVSGRAKSAEALQALLEERQPGFFEDEDAAPADVDPALAPFMRPEYSPFVPEEPPITAPPWQQRRSRPTGYSPEGQERFAESDRLPPAPRGQTTPRRSVSGGFSPSGVPARGPTPGPSHRRPPSGATPRRTTSGLRPPPDAQWPGHHEKDY